MEQRTSRLRMTGPSSILIMLSLWIGSVYGLSQGYCSSQNSGSDYSPFSDDFMSNGKCHDHCMAGYAFGIVMGKSCWCSDYMPFQQQDVGNCNGGCPGYPFENCGSLINNLYGYIPLEKIPAGTKGAPQSSTSSLDTTVPITSLRTTDVNSMTTEPPSSSTTAKPPPPPPPPSPPPSTPSSTPPTSTWTPTPVTSVEMVTVSGQVVTKTVTSMPTAPPEELRQTHKAGGVSGGVIAGAVVGSIAGIVMLVSLMFFLCLRRRRQIDETAPPGSVVSGKGGIGRNTSVLSRTGLLDKVYPSATPTTRRSSTHGMDTTADASPPSMMERRNSRPLFYDQRLNPVALMDHENGSHLSVISIQDNRDYTRTLNVTNPDPPRASYAPSER